MPGRGALVLIIAVAAWLRFTALDFGAGFDARPDEPGVINSLALMRKGPILAPALVAYGGGYMYPLYAVVSGWSWLAWPEGLVARVASAPHAVTVVARLWSAMLSTVTVFLVYAAARHLAGTAAGLVGAAIMASNVLAVREAHFAKADTAAAFAAALLLLVLVRPPERGTLRALAIGAVAGLAVSTKACIGFLPAVFLALAWPRGVASRGLDARSLAAGAAGLLAVAGVLNAYWLSFPGQAWMFARSIAHAVMTTAYLPGGDVVPGPLRYHSLISLRFGCGLAVALLALPAIVFGLYRGGALALIASSVLGYWATLLASPMVLARFFLPSVPGLAVLMAAGVVAAAGRPRRSWLVAGITAVIAAEPLAAAVTQVRLLGREDTRTLAAAWISAHVPAEAAIVSWGAPAGAADFGRPPLIPHPVFRSLPPERWRSAGIALIVHHSYPLPYSADPLPSGAPPLRRMALFDPFDDGPSDPVLEPLDAFYLPLARLSGVQRPGPRIEILAVAATPDG